MILTITEYGYKKDSTPDKLTEKGWGCWQNQLTIDGCALTDESRDALGATKLCWLRIDFKNGTQPLIRQWQDRAPEQGKDPKKPFYVKNPLRCDLYMPTGYDPFIPDEADVEVITMTE